jgi:hypothetical protein
VHSRTIDAGMSAGHKGVDCRGGCTEVPDRSQRGAGLAPRERSDPGKRVDMTRTKTPTITTAPRKYERRSEEQRISDLEAKIQQIKTRAARKSVKKDPTLRHVAKAVKSIDIAMEATNDGALRKALDEARTTLTGCLSLNGVLVPRGRASAGVDPEALLRHVREYPGQRGEQIASALATDSKGIRGQMRRLVEAGTIKTKGQRRGMQYWAA